MSGKLKTYAALLLLVAGFMFMGIGCIEKNSEDSSSTNLSSEGVTVQSSTASEVQSISVKGSDTVLPLVQAEAEEFMIENNGKNIAISGGGSGFGIAALISGHIDIATASREMTEEELEEAKANGINPVETIIAYDGISVIVNPSNSVSELTFDQLRGIYNGSINNWKDVGGEDLEIVVISRDSSSGTYEYFKEEVLQGDEYRADALTQPATGGIVGEVSQNPNAIGYIGVAYLDDTVKALNLDAGNGSEAPSSESILNGTYPLSRSLYFYTNVEPSDLTKEFIDFVLSETGQNLVTEVGYFPIKK
jgi:phosphate transport system substrate-binding protein